MLIAWIILFSLLGSVGAIISAATFLYIALADLTPGTPSQGRIYICRTAIPSDASGDGDDYPAPSVSPVNYM